MPPTLSERDLRRIELTAAMEDTADIPKVPNAGDIEERDGERVQVMHNGIVVSEGCYYGDLITEVIRRLRGHHEPQEERAVHEILLRLRGATDHPTIVELGAYWAYYSLWAAEALDGAENLLVEPDRQNLRVGERNFALNGRTGTFVRAAVGARHGGSMILQTESEGFRRTPTVTVDGLMSDRALRRIDVLFCDVQGAELQMLRGAAASVAAGRIRFLVLSTHHHRYSGDPLTHQRCLRELERLGAHFVAEHSVAESCSGDGLIVASFDARDRDFTVPVSIGRARDSVFGELEYDVARASGPNWTPRHQLWRLRQRLVLGVLAWREQRRRAKAAGSVD